MRAASSPGGNFVCVNGFQYLCSSVFGSDTCKKKPFTRLECKMESGTTWHSISEQPPRQNICFCWRAPSWFKVVRTECPQVRSNYNIFNDNCFVVCSSLRWHGVIREQRHRLWNNSNHGKHENIFLCPEVHWIVLHGASGIIPFGFEASANN